MTLTPTTNSEQKQPFLIPQIMYMCGIALKSIWLYSWSFETRATSGIPSWNGEKSTSDCPYYLACHRLSFNVLAKIITHRVFATEIEALGQIFVMSSSVWNKITTGVKCLVWVTVYVQKGMKISCPILYCRRPHDLLPYISVAVTWHQSRVQPSDKYQQGITQGHPVYRCPTREARGLCPRTVFQSVPSLDVISHIVFLYNASIMYIPRG